MNTTSRSIWKVVVALVIGAGLFVGGFAIGRSNLDIGGVFGAGRFRLGPMLGIGFGGVLAPILSILFWVLIIGSIVWLLSGIVSRPAAHTSSNTTTLSESALDILKKRYARGEISKTEYEQMRQDLGD